MSSKSILMFATVFTVLALLGCPNPVTPSASPGTGGEDSYTSAIIGTLRFVPAGRFQRDATATNISVITQPYRMSQYEITRWQFYAIMGTDPSEKIRSSSTFDPVQRINWFHAIAFCNKLSIFEGLMPVYSVTVSGTPINWATLTYEEIPIDVNLDWNVVTADWNANGYRLPTEMEWMWAAMGAPADGRAGGTNTTGYLKAFAGSTGSNAIVDYVVFGTEKSNPVGSKLANELGLYDMSGNVLEWCWDWWVGTYPTGTQIDYRGAASGTHRVLRMGSWGTDADSCTIASRLSGRPYDYGNDLGFRVVRP